MHTPILMLLVAATFGLLPPLECSAAEHWGGAGVGLNTCGQFLSHTHNHPEVLGSSPAAEMYHQWLLGFVTALNAWRLSLHLPQFTWTDQGEGFAVWLRNYCSAHPLDAFSEGVVQLTNELAEKASASLETPGDRDQ